MAKLLDQRRMLKTLNNFYKDVGYSNNSAYNARLRNVNQGAVPEEDFLMLVKTKVGWKDSLNWLLRNDYYRSPKYQLDRTQRINRLYESCRADRGGALIEDVFAKREDADKIAILLNRPIGAEIPKSKIGIKITERGIDFTHIIGFSEEVLSKYPTGKLIVYTIIGTLLSSRVLEIIITAIVKK